MLSPLGFYSKGFMQPGQKTHFNAAASTIKTAWKHCDALFEECRPDRMSIIENQFTCSLVFDNWQHSITKIWQTEGKSSIFHCGMAYLIKRDKAFVLPKNSVMQLPHGLRFKVSRVQIINVYTLRVFGILFPGQSNLNPLDERLDKKKQK